MTQNISPWLWVFGATGWLVALVAIFWRILTNQHPASSTGSQPSPVSQTPIPDRADPALPSHSSNPPLLHEEEEKVDNDDEEESEEEELTLEQLVTKFWPADVQENAVKAAIVLRSVKDETGVDWDDDVNADIPSAISFVEPLQKRGCTVVDLLVAFHQETGLHLGSIIADIMSDAEVSVDDVVKVFQQLNLELDGEELESLLAIHDQEFIFRMTRALGVSCPDLIEMYRETEYEPPDADELAEAARAAGYPDADLLRGFHILRDNYQEAVTDGLDHNIPQATIVSFLREEQVEAEELDGNFDEGDSTISFDDRINLLFALLHPPTPVEPQSAAPTAEPAEAGSDQAPTSAG